MTVFASVTSMYCFCLRLCSVVGARVFCLCSIVFFFQAEDGIRDLVRSRGLGDVYKRQRLWRVNRDARLAGWSFWSKLSVSITRVWSEPWTSCLLYTSDAADERSSVDLGGRRIIKKKKKEDLRRSLIRSTINT